MRRERREALEARKASVTGLPSDLARDFLLDILSNLPQTLDLYYEGRLARLKKQVDLDAEIRAKIRFSSELPLN